MKLYALSTTVTNAYGIAAVRATMLTACLSLLTSAAAAGPFDATGVAGRVDDPANPGATILNPELRVWAGEVIDFSPSPGVNAANGDAAKALGPIGAAPDGNTVSLGDLTADELAQGLPPGEITLRMAAPLRNGPGWDLAVFENAFAFFPPDDDKVFAELAYVEVSTDGATFARFPAESLTTTLFEPFGPAFAGIDPTDVHNLAGLHQGLTGTPLDFAELAAAAEVVSGAVRLDDIRYVRLVDIPGNGASLDAIGRGILEAWPTTDLEFGNGGHDLDAVAGRYAVPEPSTLALAAIGAAMLLASRLRRRK
ncbi:MAG: PEP-CTERM sorting domain-containing protein [Pirellulales bacterium]